MVTGPEHTSLYVSASVSSVPSRFHVSAHMQIGHYAPRVYAPGGITTYIRRTGTAQTERGHDVLYLSRDPEEAARDENVHAVDSDVDLFEMARALDLDVLHLHKSVGTLPKDRVPTLRTMHGHQGSCPSGSRYLSRLGLPCNRTPSLGGCLWGHVVDRCGSVRPGNLASNFRRLRHEVDFATQIRTLTVSDFLRDRMIDAGCPPEQIRTLRSPAPTVASPSPMDGSSPPRFLFLGRLVPQKGIMWLLRAFRETPPEATLDVAGDGDMMKDARAFVHRHGLRNRVKFHGWVDEDRVTALLQSARAVVFPSVWHEPAGLVSLEAAAHGRALIASRVVGIPEYATEAYALLVPPNDADALARAMTTLARYPERAARLGARGQDEARTTFAMRDFLDRLDAAYDELQYDASPTQAMASSV